LLAAYTTLGDIVLNIFAGTGQVACIAVELELSSVSIKNDLI